MKSLSIFRTIFVLASLVIGCVSLPAHAQAPDQTMTLTVPFAFELGSSHLAPGKYSISRPMTDVLEIRRGRAGVLLVTHNGSANKATRSSKVVFDKYGDRYFLRQIWFSPEGNSYLECTESKSEKQAKKSELASVTKSASNVEIALLRVP